MTALARVSCAGGIVDRVAGMVPWMQQRAGRLDDEAAFPTEEIAALRDAGVLTLPLPAEHAAWTDEVQALADRLADVLMRIGEGNLAVGRIIEAHFNARHLIARYGSAGQKALAAQDVREGHLFALWVTDPPQNGLRMRRMCDGIRLDGGKQFCSAAGHATRGLVTAVDEAGESYMLVMTLGQGERVRPLESPLQGMRAAVTGAIDFSGCIADRESCLGGPGDYLREPDFSGGAWRSSAVAAGGLRSLIELTVGQLAAAGRLDDGHHLQRMGNAMIADETCYLWVREAARTVEDPRAEPSHAVAYAGLARIAIESGCLDAMRLLQRSLGLSAFRRGNPVERICRDLATYLRQPAPDAVLTEAAAWFAHRSMADRA
jgi:alkylation response protein AidB-like acyl-CoA dehydrogenase